MRPFALYSLLATIISPILARPEGIFPFYDPVYNPNTNPLLVKRQSCPSGQNSCSNIGSNECCAPGQNCQFDQAGNVACCPYNVVCTGTIGATSPATSPATITSASTTSGIIVGSSTTTPITSFNSPITSGVAGGGSTVPNAAFPFIYAPTSYANRQVCSSAWSSCQAESTSCLVSLAGANGVTVSGLGPGITQTGQSGIVLTAASSICSSLSAQACYGSQLNPDVCNGFANANAGARPTACPGMIYAAGAMAGAVGALM